jgi:putative FmdB family regulatory protein
MPTYEYACSSCQHEWEIEQSIKEDAITECPSCKKATAKRQISRGGGFILKGSGWYADLYSSPSNKKDEGTKAEGAKGEGAKGEGAKGDDKPATPAPAAGAATTSTSSEASSSSGASTSSGTTPGKGSSAPAT